MNLLHLATKRAWEIVGARQHHGINIPLSSIYTKKSCGIGEFYDLLPLIDWCSEMGLDVIQLLPINDCGSDPSPYNSISSCALNPIYLSLDQLPFLDKSPHLKKQLSSLHKWVQTPRVIIPEVQLQKLSWLRDYLQEAGPALMKRDSFHRFVAENPWLKAYALFKVFKDRFDHYNWMTWPQEMKELTRGEFDKYDKQYAKEVSFYQLIQYLCFSQLAEVKKYAAERHLFIKGDIPILISPDSADVWHEPHLFDVTKAAGAPPDAYSREGQYWGFPLYRWDVMRENGFAWWKQRLRCAVPLYHVYRIDHVLGFFRIWAIPTGKSPREGRFSPEEEIYWAAQGKELLSMVCGASGAMLPVAEDLGALFPAVREVLHELGICGTRVMRWERRWLSDQSFIPGDLYDPLSMTTVSTHDSETLALWWRNQPQEAKKFALEKGWTYAPEMAPDQRKQILRDSHHTASLFHVNLLSEYLALFPELVWPNPEDERINIPGTVQATNWTYRLRVSLEELTSHQKLKDSIKEILAK